MPIFRHANAVAGVTKEGICRACSDEPAIAARLLNRLLYTYWRTKSVSINDCKKFLFSFKKKKLQNFRLLTPFADTHLQYKSLENTEGNREIAHNEQSLLNPQCFLPFGRTFRHFHQI